MNINVFKSELALHGMKMSELAGVLQISKTALYRKASGKSEFTRREIMTIVQALNLTEGKIIDIFFSQKVA